MAKVKFFYCTGTSYLGVALAGYLRLSVRFGLHWGDPAVNPDEQRQTYYIEGLNGQKYNWDGEIFNDPFPYMLNPNVWEAKRIDYNAAGITVLTDSLVGGMGESIDDGVEKVIKQITKMTPGEPFALGGYSQGAGVMSTIYNELRYGSLTSYYPGFLGGVMFGSPRRQVDFRGEIGGTWSGAWDVPGSNTGGHGCFPLDSPWGRLSACDGTEWIEFAAPDDIITSTGDSEKGSSWTIGAGGLLELAGAEYAQQILQEALTLGISILPPIDFLIGLFNPDPTPLIDDIFEAIGVGGGINYIIDAANQIGALVGAGHLTYPVLPPPNSDGTYDVTTEEITTTFTREGATTSRASRTSRGRTPPAVESVSVTHTYLKANAPTCYQLALSWLEAKAQQFAVAPVIVPSTGSVGWSTTLVPPAQ